MLVWTNIFIETVSMFVHSEIQTLAEIIMKSFFSIKLLTFGLLFCAINSFAQKCDCDSLLNARKVQYMKLVKNSDSFKFINFRKKGAIQSISEKEKISQLLNAGSAWVALTNPRDTVIIKFEKLDSIAGRLINFLDGVIIDSAKLASITSQDDRQRIIQMYPNSKAVRLKYFTENIDLTDEYFEVYFNVEGHIIMSPTVCRKSYCDLVDNIISQFYY